MGDIELSLLDSERYMSPYFCAGSLTCAYSSYIQAVTLVPGCAIELSLLTTATRKGSVTPGLCWVKELGLQE